MQAAQPSPALALQLTRHEGVELDHGLGAPQTATRLFLQACTRVKFIPFNPFLALQPSLRQSPALHQHKP